MPKLSEIYPALVGKKYCGDCLFLLMERKDDVVTGDIQICYKKKTYSSRHCPACNLLEEKLKIILSSEVRTEKIELINTPNQEII